jgi:hypothetical protein
VRPYIYSGQNLAQSTNKTVTRTPWPSPATKAQSHHADVSIQKGPKDRFSRRFSALFYTRILSNGEECDRDWLAYSKELDKLFCFSCKVFAKGHRKGQWANDGFNN